MKKAFVPLCALLLAGLLYSCGTAKLAISDELKPTATEYAVKGRTGILVKQKLSFGPFATTHVNRSWTRGTSARTGIGMGDPTRMEWVNIISTEYIRRKQTLNFGLTDGQLRTEAFCVSRFNANDLHIGRSENSILNIGLDIWGKGVRFEDLFYVQVYSGNDERPWQLVFDNHASQARAKRYEGIFAKNRDEYYTITPVTRLEVNGKAGTMPFGASGLEIQNSKGKPVAAVSLMDKGVVYLSEMPAEEKLLVATLCSALLLQQQIG